MLEYLLNLRNIYSFATAKKNKIIQLANRGIEVNENNAKELITFLADVMNLNANEIPINQGKDNFQFVTINSEKYLEFFPKAQGKLKDIKHNCGTPFSKGMCSAIINSTG